MQYNQNIKFYKGWHHFYIGLVLLLVGFYCLFRTVEWVAISISLLGLYIALDDFYQHWRQNYEIDYRSPLHRLYVSMNKPDWLIWLNGLLDRVFGK